MLVYFLGLIENKIDVMVSAELLPESVNDIDRNNITNSDYASYKGNMLKIVKIIDEFLNEYNCFHFPYTKTRHNLNSVINFPISFYLTKNRAIGSNIPDSKFTGKISKWYPDGEIHKIINFKNGWKEGYYQENWPNGKTKLVSEYVRGNFHGEVKKWSQQGKLYETVLYSNGKVVAYNFLAEEEDEEEDEEEE